jgi:putative permease
MKISSLPFYARLALVSVSILCIGYTAWLGKEILAPLIIAFLFSILLLPVAGFLEKKLRFPRSLSSMAALLLLVFSIVVIIYIIGAQLSNLSEDFPLLQKQLDQSWHDLQRWIWQKFHLSRTKQMTYVQSATDKVVESTGGIIGQTVMSVSSIVLFLVFIAIYIFFMLFHRRLLMNFLLKVFTEEYSPVVHEIVTHIQYIIKKYITGLFIQMCAVAGLTTLILVILGVKYALLLGIIAGVLNVIPYVGIFSALLLSTVITFATATPNTALIVAISIFCVHLVDSNFIMPRIVGSKVKINALITVIGVVLGEMIWGISGMFLSIPLIAITKIIFDRVESLKPWGLLLGDEDTTHKNPSEPRKVLKDEQANPEVVKEK